MERDSTRRAGQAARPTLAGFAREIAAWLEYVGPKNEAGKHIQRITKGTLWATGAWTDSRHDEDDKFVELDYELATEGAARSTVPKVTQAEPCHAFVALRALVGGDAPKSSNDSPVALQPILAPPK